MSADQPPAGASLIATHDGRFHCDEVMAVALLKMVHPGAAVVRTRDPAKIAAADIVVDVGGVYDPATRRFDHHQHGFDEHYSAAFPETKMSSAGMVWKYVANDRRILDLIDPNHAYSISLRREDTNGAAGLFYARFILPIDAFDNGVQATQEKPLYMDITTLGARIARMNTSASFTDAVAVATAEFKDYARYFRYHVMPSYMQLGSVVSDYLAGVDTTKNGGRGAQFIEVNRDLEWEGVFADVQRHHPGAADILYVLYEHSGHWRVKCVPDYTKPMFASRRLLPEHWAGRTGEQLVAATSVDGTLFCHNGRFICGNATREGAIKLIKTALQTPASGE